MGLQICVSHMLEVTCDTSMSASPPSLPPLFFQDLYSSNIPFWGRGTRVKKMLHSREGQESLGALCKACHLPPGTIHKTGPGRTKELARVSGPRAFVSASHLRPPGCLCVYLGVMWRVCPYGCGVCVPPRVQLQDTPRACVLFVAGPLGPSSDRPASCGLMRCRGCGVTSLRARPPWWSQLLLGVQRRER